MRPAGRLDRQFGLIDHRRCRRAVLEFQCAPAQFLFRVLLLFRANFRRAPGTPDQRLRQLPDRTGNLGGREGGRVRSVCHGVATDRVGRGGWNGATSRCRHRREWHPARRPERHLDERRAGARDGGCGGRRDRRRTRIRDDHRRRGDADQYVDDQCGGRDLRDGPGRRLSLLRPHVERCGVLLGERDIWPARHWCQSKRSRACRCCRRPDPDNHQRGRGPRLRARRGRRGVLLGTGSVWRTRRRQPRPGAVR